MNEFINNINNNAGRGKLEVRRGTTPNFSRNFGILLPAIEKFIETNSGAMKPDCRQDFLPIRMASLQGFNY